MWIATKILRFSRNDLAWDAWLSGILDNKKFALGAIRYKAGTRPQKGDSLAGELQ